MQRAKRRALAPVLATFMMLAGMAPVGAGAEDDPLFNNDRPSELAMMGDALIGRPFLLLSTAAGLVAYTATLPFSILGGNETEAGERLVAVPARATFLRCLGCTPRQDERLKNQQKTERANRPEKGEEKENHENND